VTSGDRTILHVDLDAFFASAEQLDDPSLRGRPVLVGGDGARGVVAAASYEARAFGCRSAQPMAEAKRRCPQAVIVRGRHARYAELSAQVFQIFGDTSPLIEPLSIDEAFIDVTGSLRLYGDGRTIAQMIRRRVRDEIGLTASVGVAHNKFLAKLASDLEKPDGLVVLERGGIREVLAPMPVERMWGVGSKTAERLRASGFRTFGDLARGPASALTIVVGDHSAQRLMRLAVGDDDRPVAPGGEAVSVGRERTFGTDLEDVNEIRAALRGQAEDVGRRLRAQGAAARNVTLKIRYGDFETITRRRTLDAPTNSDRALIDTAFGIFAEWARTSFRPVRLIGVTAGSLVAASDIPPLLFGEQERARDARLDRAVDAIAGKFGTKAIGRGRGRGEG